MEWWGHKHPHGLRHGLEDMQLVGDNQFVIGFPRYFEDKFKRRVYAAAKSFFLGLSSVDYTFKKYSHFWSFENEDENMEFIYSGTTEVKRIVISHLDYFMNIEKKLDRPSLFACSAALVRLQSSFKASILTIQSGLHFETMALERIILEQLSWIYTIYDKPDMTHFDFKPNKCITKLKDYIPYAGNLYGIFSDYTHISPSTTLEYIKASEENGLKIVLTDLNSIKQDVIYLLILSDMLGLIGEYIYSDFIKEFKFIKYECDKANFIPNEERETLKVVREYESKLNNLSNI